MSRLRVSGRLQISLALDRSQAANVALFQTMLNLVDLDPFRSSPSSAQPLHHSTA
jgi:hypothetical protein